jgi:hypothetical protein
MHTLHALHAYGQSVQRVSMEQGQRSAAAVLWCGACAACIADWAEHGSQVLLYLCCMLCCVLWFHSMLCWSACLIGCFFVLSEVAAKAGISAVLVSCLHTVAHTAAVPRV